MNFLTMNVFSIFGQNFADLARQSLVVIVCAFMIGACANNDPQSEIQNITEAYQKAQDYMEAGNYRKAIQVFEVLRARFPFSEFSKQLNLELMYAYYKMGQREQAIDTADQFLRENPTHEKADYALYIKALSYFEQDKNFLERWFRKSTAGRPPQDAELSFSLFARLLERYPSSEYAADAQQRMVYLKNRLSAYENEVARWYIRSGAYVAALNRAKNAIELYNGADSNVESLEIMIEAYEELGMTELANDTRRVLAENQPAES